MAILLSCALVFFFAVRAIGPAMSKVDSDFPNYLTAAKIVVDGGDVNRLYDDRWFQEQMSRYRMGRPHEGKFSPFPPPTALLLVPLAGFSPLNALRAMTCVSLLCLIGSILVLTRIMAWSLADSTVFVLLSGYAAVNSLRLGQPYIVVSASCILGYYARSRGRPLLAGLCFGVFAPLKYFPLVFLVYFAFRREWRLVAGGAAAILAVLAASVGILGAPIHQEFITSVLGNHLTAYLSLQNPFSASFQSLDTLFRRLFVFDATLNPQPLAALLSLQGAGVAVLIAKIAILSTALVPLVKLARSGTECSIAPSLGILGLLVLLLAPATATYHFVLLWLPAGLLVRHLFRERAPLYACFVLGTYALIGFFPYRLTAPFEGRGGLTVLAYPRLILLSAMFAACLHFIWNRTERGGGKRTERGGAIQTGGANGFG